MGNPTTTTDGQMVLNGDRFNRIAIGGFVVIGILFVVLLYLYISPLFHKRPVKHRSKESNARTTLSSDMEAGVDIDPAERETLLIWMHRRSRGRFVDITNAPQNLQIPHPPELEPRSNGKRVNSFFSRISMFPHLVFPSLPPPVYSAPPMPTCTASDDSSTSSKPPIGKPFFPAYRLSFRSKSAPSDPEGVASKAFLNRVSLVSLGSPMDDTVPLAPDSSLHPSWMPHLQSPVKAVLVKARDCSSLSGAEATPTSTAEMKTDPPGAIQQVPKKQGLSRARIFGESDPF